MEKKKRFNCGKKKRITIKFAILDKIFCIAYVVYWITMLKILGYCAFDDFNLLLVKWRKLRANQILPYKERFS